MGRDLGSRCDWSLRRGLSQRGVARPSPGHLQLLIPAPPGPPHSPLIPEGLGKSWGAVPLWRTCGPTVRAADAEAGTWARTPGALCGVGVRGRCTDCSCAPWGGGRAGAGPQAFAFPMASPTCSRLHRGPWVLGKMSPGAARPQGVVGRALGGQTGWLPQHQPPGTAAQEPLHMGGPQGPGP